MTTGPDMGSQIPLSLMMSQEGAPTQAPQSSPYVPQASPTGAMASGMSPLLQAMMMRRLSQNPQQPPASGTITGGGAAFDPMSMYGGPGAAQAASAMFSPPGPNPQLQASVLGQGAGNPVPGQ